MDKEHQSHQVSRFLAASAVMVGLFLLACWLAAYLPHYWSIYVLGRDWESWALQRAPPSGEC